MELARKCMH